MMKNDTYSAQKSNMKPTQLASKPPTEVPSK